MNAITLYGQAEDELTLKEALAKVAKHPDLLTEAVGLFYSPQQCSFGRVQPNGTVKCCEKASSGHWEEQDLNWNAVFEARIFNNKMELRWLKTGGDKGKAVLLSEEDKLPNYFQKSISREEVSVLPNRFAQGIQNVGSNEQTYLLWGEGVKTSAPEGWSILATARIGAIAVPVAGVAAKGHVLLVSREYVGTTDPMNNNMAVLEERLLRLVPQPAPTKAADEKAVVA